jgi:protein-disulfide isomerase
MRRWFLCGAAILALSVAGCGGGDENNVVAPPPGGQKIAAVPPPAGSDWTQMVTQTADGGFRMGNPNSPVKLVEYGSFGCSHCAQFDVEASEPLKDYIRSGRVSWEFRSFIIFPSDPAVSVLVSCRGADAYFTLKEQLYATQGEWMGKLGEWQNQNQAQLQQMSPPDRLKPMVQAAGLDAFFRQRGMPQAKVDSCLADIKALGQVLEISSRGSELGVTGTPAFFLNGIKLENAGTWEAVERDLKRALGE